MRICYLTTTFDETNGWGRLSARFLAELKRLNGARNVIVPEPAGLWTKEEPAWDQPFRSAMDALRLRKDCAKCDVIYAAVEPVAPLAMMLSRLTGAPHVISVAGTYADFAAYRKPVRWLYKEAFRGAAGLTVLSRYTRSVLMRQGLRAPVTIVPGGFDPQVPPRAPRPMSRPPRLLTVGYVKPRKGYHTLVDALALLKKKGMTVHADLVGRMEMDGYVERLKETIAKEGLDRDVRLLGRIPQLELDALYADADLFVLPSEHDGLAFEGLGLVFLEALGRGVPVIGAKESGAEDIIQEDANGRLVPPGDARALAAAIEGILGDETLWARLCAQAPKSAERFRWERVGAEMQAALEAAAKKA